MRRIEARRRKASAVRLRVSQYAKGQIINVAIAHGEGNYIADAETVARIEGEGRVAFRYCDARGGREGGANPNGSVNDIAGIYSKDLNVLGLMPHPESLIDPLVGGTDGRGLFDSVAGFKGTTNQDTFGHRCAGSSAGLE